jgi:hypothetical protein
LRGKHPRRVCAIYGLERSIVMPNNKNNKVRKNFMIAPQTIRKLEWIKINVFPELSYSVIVDMAIECYSDKAKAAKLF